MMDGRAVPNLHSRQQKPESIKDIRKQIRENEVNARFGSPVRQLNAIWLSDDH